jgi:hypothetical protein
VIVIKVWSAPRGMSVTSTWLVKVGSGQVEQDQVNPMRVGRSRSVKVPDVYTPELTAGPVIFTDYQLVAANTP